jgi:hypothetical protein
MSTYEPETSGYEPGLELHEWETRWEQLQEGAESDPAAALPELADLVEELLRRQGVRADDEAGGTSEAADPVGAYRFAREVSNRVERGEDTGPGDVGAAYEALRGAYGWITGRARS